MNEKILHVIPTLGVGGAETLLCDLVSWQSRRGHDVSIIATSSGGALARRVREHADLRIWNYKGSWYEAALWREFARYVRDSRVGVVHAWLHQPKIMAAVGAAVHGVPTVVSEHRLLSRNLRQRLPNVLAGRSTRVLHVCVSQAVRDSVVNVAAVPRARTRVVPNGVDPAALQAEYLSADPLFEEPSDVLWLGAMGRLEPRKGMSDLIEAAHLLQRRLRRPVGCVIAGRETVATTSNELRALARRLDVRFVHYSDAPRARLLRTVDLYVQPSYEEGFGLAVLEAITCGVPVVCTGAGGLREVVPREGLVPVGAPDAIAERCALLLAEPSAMDRYVKTATAHAAQFTLTAMGLGYEAAYQQAQRQGTTSLFRHSSAERLAVDD